MDSAIWDCRTKLGLFRLTFSDQGLVRVSFPEFSIDPINPQRTDDGDVPESVSADWISLAAAAIRRGLEGKVLDELPPLDLRGTAFQRRVWDALMTIPCGATKTYGDIAKQIGSSGAVRAVGGACGANPIPIIVPCHRVLAANSRLGGFSGGDGWKPFLLRQEGWGQGLDLPLFQGR